jgi:putative ABC transport system ATP-binding protein
MGVMMSNDLIVLRGVGKHYIKGKTRVTVHENVNLNIPAGAFVALMGPSGCGKTTLLNLIGGLDNCTEGSVEIGGQRIDRLNDTQLSAWRAQHIGIIFQFYNLMPVLTAARNVELPLLLTDLSKTQRREHVQTALKVVGLEDRAEHYPGELSGGQEQRVAIARAIVSDPVMILADEPTGDLDRKTADEIMQLLKLLNQKFGKTIIMVTHDPHAAEYASHVINLEEADLSDYRVGAAA